MNLLAYNNWNIVPVNLNLEDRNFSQRDLHGNSKANIIAVTSSMILIRWTDSSNSDNHNFSFQINDLRSDVLYSDEFNNFSDVSKRAAVLLFWQRFPLYLQITYAFFNPLIHLKLV